VSPEERSRSGTGNSAADAVLAKLDALDGLPVSEHADVFEAAHQELHAALVRPAPGEHDGSVEHATSTEHREPRSR
jgi:hypothetical protein